MIILRSRSFQGTTVRSCLGGSRLKLFADTITHLNGTSRARLGRGVCRHFRCTGADPLEAFGAVGLRRAFANSAAFVDGLAVGATVSVGAASDVGIKGDLNALFRRADAALYVAKRAGRNRVELLGPHDACELPSSKSRCEALRASPRPPTRRRPSS